MSENSNISGTNSSIAKGTSTSSLYINIAGQSTGTLIGKNVDPKLIKADRLLGFSEKIVRKVNSESVNNLIFAGEIDASWVYFKILPTPSSIFVENSLDAGNNIGPITVYTVQVINKKLTVTDETEYQNCLITGFERSYTVDDESNKVVAFEVWFPYTQRKRNNQPYNQKGQAMGNFPSLLNFSEGTLEAGLGD